MIVAGYGEEAGIGKRGLIKGEREGSERKRQIIKEKRMGRRKRRDEQRGERGRGEREYPM